MAPGPHRICRHRPAWQPRPRACAAAATAIACAPASATALPGDSLCSYPPALAPEREHQLRPQSARVIAAPGPVLREERRVEKTVGQGREPRVQPPGHRHGKTAFPPVDHVIRNETTRCFL